MREGLPGPASKSTLVGLVAQAIHSKLMENFDLLDRILIHERTGVVPAACSIEPYLLTEFIESLNSIHKQQFVYNPYEANEQLSKKHRDIEALLSDDKRVFLRGLMTDEESVSLVPRVCFPDQEKIRDGTSRATQMYCFILIRQCGRSKQSLRW